MLPGVCPGAATTRTASSHSRAVPSSSAPSTRTGGAAGTFGAIGSNRGRSHCCGGGAAASPWITGTSIEGARTRAPVRSTSRAADPVWSVST